jgi:hypothetical protein
VIVLLALAATALLAAGGARFVADWRATYRACVVADRRQRIARLEDALGLPRSDWDI